MAEEPPKSQHDYLSLGANASVKQKLRVLGDNEAVVVFSDKASLVGPEGTLGTKVLLLSGSWMVIIALGGNAEHSVPIAALKRLTIFRDGSHFCVVHAAGRPDIILQLRRATTLCSLIRERQSSLEIAVKESYMEEVRLSPEVSAQVDAKVQRPTIANLLIDAALQIDSMPASELSDMQRPGPPIRAASPEPEIHATPLPVARPPAREIAPADYLRLGANRSVTAFLQRCGDSQVLFSDRVALTDARGGFSETITVLSETHLCGFNRDGENVFQFPISEISVVAQCTDELGFIAIHFRHQARPLRLQSARRKSLLQLLRERLADISVYSVDDPIAFDPSTEEWIRRRREKLRGHATVRATGDRGQLQAQLQQALLTQRTMEQERETARANQDSLRMQLQKSFDQIAELRQALEHRQTFEPNTASPSSRRDNSRVQESPQDRAFETSPASYPTQLRSVAPKQAFLGFWGEAGRPPNLKPTLNLIDAFKLRQSGMSHPLVGGYVEEDSQACRTDTEKQIAALHTLVYLTSSLLLASI
eukprot:TRINITY_DN14175_c0_g1_i1.p1 TRINITY_DN14175_c0_g1~~TRINITY_DN14175_c0_g1_i1.p1  ORF type:complete len:547 (+),score=84.26 TRINITY_DN14175_c0_g1_i1:38-1642(+)